jgi:hypothetical protein
MADRLREKIRETAQRPTNVTINEIERVVERLKDRYSVRIRRATHGVLIGVGNQRFMVNTHSPGSKQVKSYSVRQFIDAMVELGEYEGQDEEPQALHVTALYLDPQKGRGR